ncbi:hypothetical protein HGM15179_008663 [Zosterops borbonicus]|uniref:Uncharacterized protein n=1 Tax=Zosterops borbonicus TaxID=364589 RepID=A0A8K1LLQ1_9PASS|nr:hypothetical protein HGM15179_008663 [Zosterops borbonicus]
MRGGGSRQSIAPYFEKAIRLPTVVVKIKNYVPEIGPFPDNKPKKGTQKSNFEEFGDGLVLLIRQSLDQSHSGNCVLGKQAPSALFHVIPSEPSKRCLTYLDSVENIYRQHHGSSSNDFFSSIFSLQMHQPGEPQRAQDWIKNPAFRKTSGENECFSSDGHGPNFSRPETQSCSSLYCIPSHSADVLLGFSDDITVLQLR